MNRRLRLCSLAFAVALLVGCRSQQSRLSAREWDMFVSGFIETYFEANPLFAVYQGRHEFDGRFPDWSEAGLRKWARRLHGLRDSAAGTCGRGWTPQVHQTLAWHSGQNSTGWRSLSGRLFEPFMPHS